MIEHFKNGKGNPDDHHQYHYNEPIEQVTSSSIPCVVGHGHIITLDVADNGRDRSRMTVRIDGTTTADLEKAFDINYRYVADSRELLHDQLLNVLDVPTAVPTA
ncbi:hypothetical protein E2P81_ATG10188 [Venturia nashicola]|nr:hypothetical protein E2P81_ATG10188 [Venturia nashicola]